MRILALGDVVGTRTIDHFSAKLPGVQKAEKIDFTVCNGENVSEIRGITARDAEALLAAGIDLLTLGNHAFGMRDIYPYLDANEHKILRPANYPPTVPGCGSTVVDVRGYRMLCINVSGIAFLDPLSDPFDTVEKILSREEGRYDFALMDIHAEATSEKLAIARAFDGRVQILFGTHTHVTTADERVLPNGSGYITDLGMCGPENGILGTDADAVLYKFRTHLPTRFSVADGDPVAHGAVFDLDEDTGRVRSVRRITF